MFPYVCVVQIFFFKLVPERSDFSTSTTEILLGAIFKEPKPELSKRTLRNQNAPRPSEHPPGEIIQNLLWHLNGFPDGNNIGSTV